MSLRRRGRAVEGTVYLQCVCMCIYINVYIFCVVMSVRVYSMRELESERV